jgi:hypothetical protein
MSLDHLTKRHCRKSVNLVGIAVTVEENPVQKDTEFMSRDLGAGNCPAEIYLPLNTTATVIPCS